MIPLFLLKPSRFILVLLAVTLLAQSCKEKQPGCWKNEQIPALDAQNFHELNDELITAMRTNNKQTLENMLSKELLDDPSTKRKIELVAGALKADTSYSVINEYYVINKNNDRDTIIGNNSTDAQGLNYPVFAKEMYMAFLLPARGIKREQITIMYANYDYGWRLCNINKGPYIIDGKTAMQP